MSKKSITLSLIFAFISMQAFATILTSESEHLKLITVVVDGIKTEKVQIQGQEFDQVRLIGVEEATAVQYQVGAPNIPVLRFYVQADNATDIKVTLHETKSTFTKNVSQIAPVLPSLEKISGSSYDKSSFVVTNVFNVPSKKFSIVEVGSIRGQKLFLVTLYPVDFNNNQVRLTNHFDVLIKKSNVDEVPMPAQDGIVFIIAKKFLNSSSLIKYMDLRKKAGLSVLSLVVTDPNPETIRASVKDLYKRNPSLKYALIVGDSADVPGHESTIISGTTDQYFASLDNYDSDLNTPELTIGRITPVDETQLDIIMKKFTSYLADEYSRQAMLSYVSFLATDDRYEVAEATHNYAIDNYTFKANYNGIFPNASQAGGDKLYAITHSAGNSEVMKSILEGRTIVNYSGHGALDMWDAPRVSQDDVRSLQSSMLPFVISNSCITGDFREDEAFAETWIRHEFGAITFWGSMDSTYWDEDDILEKRMYDGIFTKNKQTFGDITNYALSETWREYGGQGRSQYYRETYHIFGDPSIKLKIAPF